MSLTSLSKGWPIGGFPGYVWIPQTAMPPLADTFPYFRPISGCEFHQPVMPKPHNGFLWAVELTLPHQYAFTGPPVLSIPHLQTKCWNYFSKLSPRRTSQTKPLCRNGIQLRENCDLCNGRFKVINMQFKVVCSFKFWKLFPGEFSSFFSVSVLHSSQIFVNEWQSLSLYFATYLDLLSIYRKTTEFWVLY